MLQEQNPEVQYEAAEILINERSVDEHQKKLVLETLVTLLSVENKQLRRKVAWTIAEDGNLQGVETLMKLLDDDNVNLRCDVIDDLYWLDLDIEISKEQITKLLFSDDFQVRLKAIQFEHPDHIKKQALVEILSHKDCALVLEAVQALINLDCYNSEVESSLVRCVSNENLPISIQAAQIMIKQNHPDGILSMFELLFTENKEIQRRAYYSLVNSDLDAESLDKFKDRLRTLQNEQSQVTVAKLLAMFGHYDVTEILVDLLVAEDIKVRRDSYEFLAAVSTTDAKTKVVDTLISRLDSENRYLRFQIATLLTYELSDGLHAIMERIDSFLADITLLDNDKVSHSYGHSSLANFAYRFLVDHLSPSGIVEVYSHN